MEDAPADVMMQPSNPGLSKMCHCIEEATLQDFGCEQGHILAGVYGVGQCRV